jgi:hypothetical protein
VKLRAERAGNGDGRIYTITIMATDACGNTSSKTATVIVAIISLHLLVEMHLRSALL